MKMNNSFAEIIKNEVSSKEHDQYRDEQSDGVDDIVLYINNSDNLRYMIHGYGIAFSNDCISVRNNSVFPTPYHHYLLIRRKL